MHFTLDGKDSRDIGIYLMEPMEIMAAEEEIEFLDVSGRDGSLTIKKGGHLDIETEMECYIKDISRIGEAYGFLRGSGRMVVSYAPYRAYKVIFTGVPQASRLNRALNAWPVTVPVRLKPFRYFEPEPQAISIYNSGDSIDNPGTQASAPRIAIYGTGDISVTIGTQVIAITGIEEGLIIDSDLKNCYELDGTTRIYDDEKIDIDKFPLLMPGINYISWTGSVSEITILPRWRDR